jgi:tetratricopeptide (TPR) repeat protein
MKNETLRAAVALHPISGRGDMGYFCRLTYFQSRLTAVFLRAFDRSKPLCLRLVLTLGCFAQAAPATAAETLDNEIVLTPQTGAATEVEIRHWQERAGAPKAAAADFERLGWAFVAKARRTLDGAYYTLAEKTAGVCEARFGASPATRLLRGHVFHNEHRFREAEEIARGLVVERGAPEDFALLSDALMEQGKLTAAVEALQRMVNLRPGVEASSRIAHLRWLKGDLPGAIAAMEDAARAASPQDAATIAWVFSRLAGLYLQAGRAEAAIDSAEAALRRAPDFPPALLARGRALLALGKSEPAVAPLRRAAGLNPLPEYQWWLADALRAAGHGDEAVAVERALAARGAASDPRTLAIFLATRRANAAEIALALRLAREELANRGDVHTHDALAWALAAGGEPAAAEAESQLAMAEHTADARLYFHAGEIALARGEREAADKFFAQARPLAAALTPSERAALAGHSGSAAVAQVR